MKRNIPFFTTLFLLLLLLGRCKDKYDSPYHPTVQGYLVVEGYIAGNAPTSFKLSRVIPLDSVNHIPAEIHAKVQVEGSDNTVFSLPETSAGVYSAPVLALNPAMRYRLRVTTVRGAVYLSDYATYKDSPAIDSISWQRTTDGVTIYANTHDPANATRYYQWDFTETWEYNSAEFSNEAYRPTGFALRGPKFDTVTGRNPSEYIYTCWRTRNSTPLILGSSAKLTNDEIYLQKLQYFPNASQELSVDYSIIVRQYALTDSAYNFLSLMKANTESLGSIFDAQPSELKGNIHSVTNPSEQVVGYVSAGTIQQQRIFINRYQLPNWGYTFSCQQLDYVVPPDSIWYYFGVQHWIPIDGKYAGCCLVGYYANDPYCVDCTTQGGTTIKPPFWQ
jgi:hypothetical protein